MRQPRPWVLVVLDASNRCGPGRRPVLLGYKTEKQAIEGLLEMLGLEDQMDVEEAEDDLEVYHEGDGWYSHHGRTVGLIQLEFPVE